MQVGIILFTFLNLNIQTQDLNYDIYMLGKIKIK